MAAGADAEPFANRTAIAVGRDHVLGAHRVGLAADDISDAGGDAAGVLLERNQLGCVAHRRAELFGARANERLQALLGHEQTGRRTDRGDAVVEVGDIGRDLPAGERLDGVDAAVRIELLLGGGPHPVFEPDGTEHLKGAQMKMPGARMDGGAVVTLDRQVRHAVPGEECRGGQPDQAAADDEDIGLDHALAAGPGVSRTPLYFILRHTSAEQAGKTGFHPGASPGQAFSGSCFLVEHDLFGKPASTPDQVRGRLFPDHAFWWSMIFSENRLPLFRIML